MRKYVIIPLMLTTMFGIFSCAQERTISQQDWEETTLISYDFTDSSTPPEHHRSYHIGIDKDSIRVRVYSYGNMLLHAEFPSSQEILDKAKATLASQNIKMVKPSEESLICGGTADAVAFFKGEEQKAYFSASIYGGVGTLSMSGSPAAAFHQALPVSIETIIDETRGYMGPAIDGSDLVKLVTAAEAKPRFTGGENALNEFIKAEMDRITVPRKMQGTVVVDLVVEEDGYISDAWVSKSSKNEILDECAVDIVRHMPPWRPGRRNGEVVKMTHRIPLKLMLMPKK